MEWLPQVLMLFNYHCEVMEGKGSSSEYLTLKVLVVTIDAQWEGMGDVGLTRYELSYDN